MQALRVFTGATALSEAGPAYDAVLGDAPVTCRRPWLQAWVDSFPGWEPWVLVGDGAAAALARRRRGPVTRVVALGTGPSDETRLPAHDPASGDRFAGQLLSLLPTRWTLLLEQLPPDCSVLAGLVARLPHAVTGPGDGLPRVDLGDAQAHVSRNTRQAVSKGRRQLEQAGFDVVEERVVDRARIAATLPELLAVHRARDVALGRRPDHDDPGAEAFYRAVVAAHDVELFTLRASGVLAAYVLGFPDGRSFGVWDNRVNPDFQQYSAGRITNALALTTIAEDPAYDVFDWMRGTESYKLSSATRTDPTAQLRAWSHRPLRVPHQLAAAGRDLRATNPVAARVFAALGKPLPRPV